MGRRSISLSTGVLLVLTEFTPVAEPSALQIPSAARLKLSCTTATTFARFRPKISSESIVHW